MAGQLAAVRGNPADAIEQVRSIVLATGADTSAYDRLAELLALICDEPSLSGKIQLDFSLSRGIAYYNGIIFDVLEANDFVLGGGGRYDALALALGGRDVVPALGLAYTLESLLAAMPEDPSNQCEVEQVLVHPETSGSNASALREASEIRRNGGIAVLQVGGDGSTSGYSRTITV